MSLLYIIFSKLLQPLSATVACIAFLLSPLRLLIFFIYSSVRYLVTLPYHVMLKLENVYIYVGCAAIIGMLLGSCVALFSHLLKESFGLYQEEEHQVEYKHRPEQHERRQTKRRVNRRLATVPKQHMRDEYWTPKLKTPQRPSRIDLDYRDEHITRWLLS